MAGRTTREVNVSYFQVLAPYISSGKKIYTLINELGTLQERKETAVDVNKKVEKTKDIY